MIALWDENKDDGLLYGYCTYEGKVPIPMTPAGRVFTNNFFTIN